MHDDGRQPGAALPRENRNLVRTILLAAVQTDVQAPSRPQLRFSAPTYSFCSLCPALTPSKDDSTTAPRRHSRYSVKARAGAATNAPRHVSVRNFHFAHCCGVWQFLNRAFQHDLHTLPETAISPLERCWRANSRHSFGVCGRQTEPDVQDERSGQSGSRSCGAAPARDAIIEPPSALPLRCRTRAPDFAGARIPQGKDQKR